jgi:hypothetical protein
LISLTEDGQGGKKKLKRGEVGWLLSPFLKGRRVGIDNIKYMVFLNNLTPLIHLSLQGEVEIFKEG